jgi:hypothetical protein
MTVDYRPTRFDGAMQPTDLVLRLDRRSNTPSTDAAVVLAPLPPSEQPDQDDPVRSSTTPAGTDEIGVQLQDHESGTWVEFEAMKWGSSYRIAEPSRFVDPSGSVRVRFVNRDNDNEELGLGLRVEGFVP